jgi:hypothetical protein
VGNWTNEELASWLSQHGGEVSRKENATSKLTDSPTITIVAKDGSTVTVSSDFQQDTNGTWRMPVSGTTPPRASASGSDAPPREKDEGGRRYVYNEDTHKWEDVGSAPPNPQERAQAESERAERERQEAIRRAAEVQAETNRLARERMEAERANTAADNARADRGEARAEASANRPQIISAPPGQRRIAQADAAGNITSVDNPNFDQAAYDRQAAKEQAQAERDRLALQIEAGKLTEATAAAQYKRWFDENVTLPIQRAQEARARAAELRAAQEAEDRRQQFAATYEKDRQTTAISAGNQAANAFNSNLQYQVGPKFGEQFAGALNSLQGGPPQQFTADAFTFKGPSIEAVARKATAKALAGISPYAQAIATAGQRDPQVASYDQSMTPAAVGPSAAPPQGTPPDYAGMINQYLQNNPYVPGGGGDEED